MLRGILQRYKTFTVSSEARISLLTSTTIFFVSLVFNFYAGVYATNHASNYVEDIVLSNIPVFDVGGIFIWGTFIAIVFATLLTLSNPRRIPFILHSLALFFFIRGCFVSLTHLAPYPTQAPLDLDLGTIMSKQLAQGADFFFSGHTGAPFLFALMFWHIPTLRYAFLALSVSFGAIVLLGHLHYSIDVLSAFFITYSIFHLSKWLFLRDFELFHSENNTLLR